MIEIEHPSGKIAIDLDADFTNGRQELRRAALVRTARRIFEGSVCVPEAVWNGNRGAIEPQAAVTA
jgi:2-methylaconitate cis-trans-isomerase PrpF